MASSRPLWQLRAVDVVKLLKSKKVTPLELIDVVEARLLETESTINASPITCFDRARKRAKNLMDTVRCINVMLLSGNMVQSALLT